jgi:hypothetical protein
MTRRADAFASDVGPKASAVCGGFGGAPSPCPGAPLTQPSVVWQAASWTGQGEVKKHANDGWIVLQRASLSLDWHSILASCGAHCVRRTSDRNEFARRHPSPHQATVALVQSSSLAMPFVRPLRHETCKGPIGGAKSRPLGHQARTLIGRLE